MKAECWPVQSKEEPGSKWDAEKVDWSFLPSSAIEEIIKVYMGGAKKYGRGNYRKGISYSRVFSAAMRHLWAWWRGEETDPESGLSHLAHACWNVITLLEYTKGSYGKFDDRGGDDVNEH
jgi:hypothetical protein